MATEKITNPTQIPHWPGHMETDYVYTLGVAGERFFTEMAENERILGGKCKRCGLVFVPPRLYCEECFGKVTDWVDVGTKGEVFTFTVAYVDNGGAA
ncbi:MAG: zinc ribbon domain-containing protein, partial [Candidatus Bathyarchaeota archaeon]|nr:zinc ribbon domain-containing protein [Candidatus Bathyarchaeota archaeon]